MYGETSNAPPLQYYNFTTNIYAMAAAAERNSSFVAAENGSEFLFGSTSGLGCTMATDQCQLALFFYSYGGNEYHPCSDPKLFAREALAGIVAEFKTTGEYNVNGVWVSHGWDLQDPSIHSMSADEVFLYTSFTCR